MFICEANPKQHVPILYCEIKITRSILCLNGTITLLVSEKEKEFSFGTEINGISDKWQKFSIETPGNLGTNTVNLAICLKESGSVDIDEASFMPQNNVNGVRREFYEIFKENFGESDHYFFDEIQNVPEWERFIRQKHDEGKKIIITGSNASLLSRELGTKLTGRHLTYELFPFSYKEMLKLKGKKESIKTLREYLNKGGFPEYLKYEKTEILQELLKDILARDIIVRHKLKDSKIIKELTIYLISNIGKEFSYNKLKEYFNTGSTNTIISYISFLEDSFVLFTVPRFDYSLKKQIINPKKIYAIDTGLIRANTTSFTLDDGRIIENAVFLHLRKKYKEIFYYKGNRECDFLIKEGTKITHAVQVCNILTEENKQREIEGLQEAMQKFNLKKGTIITMDQKDKIENVEIIPLIEFFKR